MAASEDGETNQIVAAIGRLDQRVDHLAALLRDQGGKLDRLLALVEPVAPDEEPSLQEVMERLVATTADNGVLLLRIHRQLEQQGLGTGERTA